MIDQRLTIFDFRLCNLYSKTDTSDIILPIFLIAVDDKMAAKLFSSRNKSSSGERDSFTCNLQLTPCNIYRLLNVYCKVWRRTQELASASLPYERVPNISQYTFNNLFMPPTSEKLRGHIGLGLSVRQSVRPSVRNPLAAEKLKNRLC